MYLITALVVAIIGVAVYFVVKPIGDNGVRASSDKVIASVNEKLITLNELQEEIDKMPPQFKQTTDDKFALNQLIDRKLLEEVTSKEDIDVQPYIDNILKNNNLTLDELKSTLENQSISFDEFKSQMRILVFLNQSLFSKIIVSDQEVEEFYDNNPSFFVTPEMVRAKHILVSFNNKTDAEALKKIKEIQTTFEVNNSKFCELVTSQSEDPGSISSCGEYPAFSMNENFVQEFKDAAFNNKVGEASIAKTQFGYHLIWTVEKTPASTVKLSDVSEEIREVVLVEKQKAAFNNYISELRKNAQIINCLETPDATICNDDDEVKEVVITSPTIDETPKTTTQTLDSFADCLSKKGVKMYGAYWCSHCNAQKEAFGDAFKKINNIECTVEGNPNQQSPACISAGIKGYPTWEINGKYYPGEQTFQSLSKLSGCNL